MSASSLKNFETLQSLCKRRGYVFQNAEIYGGLNACWDYGPLGVQLKRNLADLWWKTMLCRSDIVGLDSSILSHPEVLKASGHVSAFTDPLVDCLNCKCRFRLEDQKKCPQCGSQKTTEPRPFNLMFKTHAGSIEDQGAVVYLRPETAQGIYVQFLNIQTSMRKNLPFGVAQIGKAFRNEITPGPFTFRTREFEQMEMQYFINPQESTKWYNYWKEKRFQFYEGVLKNIRFREHSSDELAHYASQAVDIEYSFPIGWKELEGIHDRGQYDLKMHQEGSRKNLSYSTSAGDKLIPHVIETSVGLDRLWLALLCESYREDELEGGEKRVILALPKSLAPIQMAFLPLSKKEALQALALKLRDQYAGKYFVDYDETGSIGKRYRRQDEIGTPLCVTIDFKSLEDHQVTVRDRDKMTQDRVAVDQLTNYLNQKL